MFDTAPGNPPKGYMITGPQIRAARALLRWSAAKLAGEAGVSRPTVERAETADGVPEMKTHNLLALQRALEGSGVVFTSIEENGVKLTAKS